VPVAWTIKNSKGHVFSDLVGGSRLEVGRKIMPTRYDAFRLQVSSYSYREVFHRDLENVLAQREWWIVPVKRRARDRRRHNRDQLEFKLN